MFALIARERATQTYEQWVEVGRGDLVITQQALVLAAPGRATRIPWSNVTAVSLDTTLDGISITQGGQHFHFRMSQESCPWFYVASMFLAFNDHAPALTVPREFFARARLHGRIT
jgi:hypothetical protein